MDADPIQENFVSLFITSNSCPVILWTVCKIGEVCYHLHCISYSIKNGLFFLSFLKLIGQNMLVMLLRNCNYFIYQAVMCQELAEKLDAYVGNLLEKMKPKQTKE